MKINVQKISLRTRIMLATLIPVGLSFAIICSIFFVSLFDSLSAATKAEFLQISQKHSRSFETKINYAINYLSVTSSMLEGRVAEGYTDREALQRNMLSTFESYAMLDGSSVYFEPNMFDGKDAEYKGTDFGTPKSGRIGWYFYKDGDEIAYLPEGIGDDVEYELPHYVNAKQANKPIYTDPTVYEIDGSTIPMFTVTYPINNKNGEFIGAVTVDLFLDDIYEQMKNEQIYQTGYMVIANDNEQVIYSPNYEDVGRTRSEVGLTYTLPYDDDVDFQVFNATSMLNGKDTLIAVNTVYIPQLDSKFFVSVAAPMSEINASGTLLVFYLVSLGVLVTFAIAGLIYFFIRRISAPLNDITHSVDRIAGGEYSARIQGDYSGEFAVVKDSVNTMANSIEAYISQSQNSLNILKTILNGLDAVIYVSDPVTCEILFVNDAMKQAFNIEGDGTGRLCYTVFQQGLDARCDFCPCYKLDNDPDAVIVWEEHNSVTGRMYRNTDRYIDWVGGVKAHLQHAVDITDLKEAQDALDRRLGQQALMTAISQTFLTDDDTETLVSGALRMVGEFMRVSQIIFLEIDSDGETFVCRSEWRDPAFNLPCEIGMRVKPQGQMLSMIQGISSEKESILISNDPATKAIVAPYRDDPSENFIATPIFIKDSMCGALDFTRPKEYGDWSESDISLAVLLSSLLSGVFERSRMEAQLRRVSSIVESSPQFILYFDTYGDMNYVNPAAVSVTGYSEEDLLAGGLEIIFEESTVGDIKETYIPATLKNGTASFEIDLICKDGRRRIMSFSTFTTGAESQNIGGIARDVTEIRKLQAELIAAKELAEQGSRSKSEFLSRMSHEMRTPMNAIIGMTSIAKSSADPEKKEYCLDRIDNASRHLLGVINDILDMSKIEADKFELSYAEFGFEKMLRAVLDVINFRIEEKKQEFSLYVDPAVPAGLVGDEQRLAQVITNLLSNAVKFTADGGQIGLNARVISEENDFLTLQIEVIDSGIGISAEQQSKLFRSFEQANGSIARKFGGTGLGLAISKRIVELMDGKIWVESELGKGSSFIFTFKAARGQYSPVDSLNKRFNIAELNILAVDDSTEVCEYFRHIMAELGAPCSVAASGEEALKIFQSANKPFDIVFVDWKMPGMNGIEFTKKLRELEDSHPIIIMISVAEWSDIECDALGAGVNGFVPKPLFPSLLLDCIVKYMGAAIAEDEAGEPEPQTRSFKGKTALLAEDVDINREIILTVLEDTELVIECAENGQRAVDLFSANPEKYDIIFMDVHMPEVDGLEATRRIRNLGVPQSSTIPIVAMTANVFREDIDACLNAGMNDHIGKPIDFDDLFVMLRKHLG